MILALSTSGPMASVAVFGAGGHLLFCNRMEAARAAGRACLEMLEAWPGRIEHDARFVADVGPGGFSAVKVGVTLAKTLAFSRSALVAGVSSFDLIDPSASVAVPVQRDKYVARRPGLEPEVCDAGEAERCDFGYGSAFEQPTFPDAARAASLLDRLEWIRPESLVPAYVLMPSISQPKRPFGPTRAHA